MISKVLWYIQSGTEAVKIHTKFVFIIVLLFVFPLLTLQFIETARSVSLENTKTAQKETVAIVHSAVHTSFSALDTEKLIDSLSENLNSPFASQMYRLEQDSTSLEHTSDDSLTEISEFIKATTPSNGDVFIFESFELDRVWTASSKFTHDNDEYLLVTYHNFGNTDAVISSRLAVLYGYLFLVFFFLITVAYWLVKQVNWKGRYESLNANIQEQELLIDTITHEFRAPLTAVKGHVSFLHESNRLRNRDLNSLNVISDSTERLLNLVNDFLEVAKIQSGNLELKTEKVSLSEIVYRVVGSMGSSASEKGLVLRDATQKSDIHLTTDRARLEQIITNVVSNAIKYTDRGSVVISYEKNPLFVTIRIQDTGTGISAQDQKKLFMPFSRVGGVEKTKTIGSGLGMWITKKLAEILGGTVEVESIKSVGTHVVITFDLRKIAAKTREGIL